MSTHTLAVLSSLETVIGKRKAKEGTETDEGITPSKRRHLIEGMYLWIANKSGTWCIHDT